GAGAVCAVAVGATMLPALLAIAPATTGALGNVSIDWRVAMYAFGCAALASGGMLLRTLARTSRAAPGFDAAGVLTAQLQLPPTRYTTGPARVAAIEQVIERIASIPGVTQSGATMNRF